ncbi:hypothetical protein [Comamonas thiooxydans]|uniref:Uncharacterized protein n=1 Tax=Comamonas thiooxydans TaxID=363952 RepID=A0A0E3CFH0_9BURK|nr:hypothetical protein [Comamonas thiooxydans]KGH10144.1 hypothetical protein P608_15755 [Comamonas thiooxydans]KGH17543.1 hypothetical protein P607_16800 [Comamonas thiooxydans]KGH22162.1 hypothetical protein P606_16970 [Comamonas thiooxydans]
MKTRQQALAAAALAFSAFAPALAQVKCTMPNQKVITLQTATRCPPDALKAETLDGKDITPPASQRPPAPRTSAPPKAEAPKPVENHIVRPRKEEYVEPFDAARVICDVIEEKKAGLCSIDQQSRPTKSPSIRVTTSGTVDEMRQLCQTLAKSAHDLSKGSMRTRFWSVKVYSRHDIFTPVASCNV